MHTPQLDVAREYGSRAGARSKPRSIGGASRQVSQFFDGCAKGDAETCRALLATDPAPVRMTDPKSQYGIQALGLSGAPDATVADWALAHDRVIVTQDRPLAGLATERIRAGQHVRIVVVHRQAASPGQIADDLARLEKASRPENWYGPQFVPIAS